MDFRDIYPSIALFIIVVGVIGFTALTLGALAEMMEVAQPHIDSYAKFLIEHGKF